MHPVVDQSAGCPFHGQSSKFQHWLETGLLCSAGKREFKLDRYHVAFVANGKEYAQELEYFRREVLEFHKTGFLAILSADTSGCRMAEDELWQLGTVMRDAGLTPSVASLINGDTLALPFPLVCPVTGEETVYEFFPVAFCQNAANRDDPLYDPSLSAPFSAINTTSDAFAFALLVRDLCRKALHRFPAEVTERAPLEAVMTRAIEIWQNMSINTILGYNRAAGSSERAVQLAEDRRFWLAPHNDPVFAELSKFQHAHEMPRVYARRLCDRWLGTIFDAKPVLPARDGQSGGRRVEAEQTAPPPPAPPRRLPAAEEARHELHQL